MEAPQLFARAIIKAPLTQNEQTEVFTKILKAAEKHFQRPLNISNLTFHQQVFESFKSVNFRTLAKANVQSAQYLERINSFLKQQPRDLMMGINYSQLSLSQSPAALLNLLQKISAHALISIYEFPNFKYYFNHALLNKMYKYREVITTSTSTIYIFCSNYYWYSNGSINKFDEPPKLTREWIGTETGYRRYYFNSDYILKYYQLSGKQGYKIAREISHEIKFLSVNNAENGFAPKMIEYYLGKHECWILREKAHGTPLSEHITEGLSFDPILVFTTILQQASSIENQNFYHTDLQTRNVLILTSGTGLLIDYGAIEFKAKRFMSGYFAFIMLGYEIFHRIQFPSPRKFIPDLLTGSHLVYLHWIRLVLSTPCQDWSFAFFLHCLEEAKSHNAVCKIDYENFQRWLHKIHALIRKKRMRLRRLEILMVEHLNSYFIKPVLGRRITGFLRQKGFMLYDSVSWAIKSLFVKRVG